MGLDWSTFFLELINFLILLWLLKRFLYAPVRAAIAARAEQQASILDEARSERAAAEALRSDYESDRRAWETERATARAALEQELAAERARRLETLQAEIDGQREKAGILAARKTHEHERELQTAALALGCGFAARLLARLADQDLEARLIRMLIEDLSDLSPAHRQALTDAGKRVRVQSAHPLSDGQRHALQEALEGVAEHRLKIETDIDPELIAGLRIDAGPLVMRANLRDELRLFGELGQR